MSYSMSTAQTPSSKPAHYRWVQLILGVICMCMIANLQYGWTFFIKPMQAKHPDWAPSAITLAFTIFVATETWLVPIEGWFVDRFGPKIVTLFGGLLCGIGWVLNAYADSLPALYFAAAISGIGAGAVYGTCVGNSIKWFPDRRGFAAGVTAMGFGAGSALTVVPIQNMIATRGYEATFFNFGIGQGLVVMVLALFLASPKAGEVPAVARVSQSLREYTPREMLRSPVFYVMYAMFVMMAVSGLMTTAQLAPIAADFKVTNTPVNLLGWVLPALSFASTLGRVLNGVTRPFFGWVSDNIGRENTMFLAFSLEGASLYMLYQFGADPLMFVLLTGLVFFASGEIYSLFPATCGDTFGVKFAAANAGLLYTAKGTASLCLPFTDILTTATGSWQVVFFAAAAMNIIAALMAIFVLKPMRAHYLKGGAPVLAPAE